MMLYRSLDDAAAALAFLLERNKTSRARITRPTLRKITGRRIIRASLVEDLGEAALEHDVGMVELADGTFALSRLSALEEAPVVSLKATLSEEEQEAMASDPAFFAKRIEPPGPGHEDEDAQLPL